MLRDTAQIATDVELAYLAGVLDSDGFITIGISVKGDKRYFGAKVGIAGSRRESHDLAARIFGGAVYCYQPRGDRAGHKPIYQWNRWGSAALTVVTSVQPYLRVKAEHAQVLMDFWEVSSVAQIQGDDVEVQLAEFVDYVRSLNARVGRKQASGGKLLDGREHHEFPAMAYREVPAR